MEIEAEGEAEALSGQRQSALRAGERAGERGRSES
jgi:hypothetical protein